MFYAHFVLSKKGPLAKIWLAAHWDKKLTKAHVFETNIESSVEGILQPKVKMALRTSGHLLLGIVRIYSRKAKYLLADCNEAFIKIKMAFRPGIVDLPEGNREAAVATITLPEVFHDFDSAMPDITIDMDAQVTLNQSRAEDITLKEDYGSLTLMGDDVFDDASFEPEVGRDGTNIDEGFDHADLLLTDEKAVEKPEETMLSVNMSNSSISKHTVSLDVPLKDDGFGGTVGEGLLDGESGGLFEPAGLFDDAPLGDVPLENHQTPQMESNVEEETNKQSDHLDDKSDDDMYDMGPASMGVPSPPSSPMSPHAPVPEQEQPGTQETALEGINGPSDIVASSDPSAYILPPADTLPPSSVPSIDQSTLINNEEETFALAPLDTTIMQGLERTVKTKRKRKLIVDEVKNISGEEMKFQLSDTTDIVTALDLAPPTKRLMLWKETGGVEKLFALPGNKILNRALSKVYQRHLVCNSIENDEFGVEEDGIQLDADIEQARENLDTPHINPYKKQRQENANQLFPQDLHIDSMHLDVSRPAYVNEHNLSHTPLDVQNFLHPQQHMFPPHSQQMFRNVIQHPPPAHLMQQMIHPDVNQLAHLQDVMHSSIMEQSSQLHSIAQNIHNIPSAVFSSEPYQRVIHQSMESVPNHLLSSALHDHMHQLPMDRPISHHSPMASQLNEQTILDQLSQSSNNMPSMDNSVHHCTDSEIVPPHVDKNVLQPPTEENAPHSNLEDFTQSFEHGNALSATVSGVMQSNNHNVSIVNDDIHDSNIPNDISQKELNQQDMAQLESNQLFDSINVDNNNSSQNNNHNLQTESDVNDNNILKKTVDFPLSDDDDYGAPSSVGPAFPEEQMADETYEQFEERILTKRTTHMLHIISSKLDTESRVSFASVVRHNKRKQVAQKFYTFLVLKKQQAVELEQSASFSDLIITKGPRFDVVYNST